MPEPSRAVIDLTGRSPSPVAAPLEIDDDSDEIEVLSSTLPATQPARGPGLIPAIQRAILNSLPGRSYRVTEEAPLTQGSARRYTPYRRPAGGMTRQRGQQPFRRFGNVQSPLPPTAGSFAVNLQDFFPLNLWRDYAYAMPVASSSNEPAVPTPKYDSSKSHPKKLARHFKKNVINPDDVIDLATDSDEERQKERWEEVPICAGCDAELFLGDQDNHDASRPLALKCGHLICAQCAASYTARYKAQSKRSIKSRKRPAAATRRTRNSRKAARGANGDGDYVPSDEEKSQPINQREAEAVTIPLEDFRPCPVPGCDSAGTKWGSKIGSKDGLWQVFV